MPPKSPHTATVPITQTRRVTTAPVTSVLFCMTGRYPNDTSQRHRPTESRTAVTAAVLDRRRSFGERVLSQGG